MLRKNRHIAVYTERSQVVNPSHMVIMAVGNQHSVEPVYSGAESLLTKIGRRVNHYAQPVSLYPYR